MNIKKFFVYQILLLAIVNFQVFAQEIGPQLPKTQSLMCITLKKVAEQVLAGNKEILKKLPADLKTAVYFLVKAKNDIDLALYYVLQSSDLPATTTGLGIVAEFLSPGQIEKITELFESCGAHKAMVQNIVQEIKKVGLQKMLLKLGHELFAHTETENTVPQLVFILKNLKPGNIINNLTGNYNHNPLIFVALGDPHMFKMLIEAGLDVNQKDDYLGETVMITAVRSHGHSPALKEIIQLLLNAGAQVNAIDNQGKTVLDRLPKDNIEVKQILLNAGAKSGRVWYQTLWKRFKRRWKK